MIYDVVVIGGGVTGCSVARYLSLYDMSVVLLEKESELCTGTSKANSGIAHAGHDPLPGTLKAFFNVRGNQLLKQLEKQLDIDMVHNGSLVISFDDDDRRIRALYERGLTNGVKDMKILERDEILTLEPAINPAVTYALKLGTGSIVCPFSLTYAMAENAEANGCMIMTGHKVIAIRREGELFRVITERGDFLSGCIVNASGVYADLVNDMAAPHAFTITPKRGEYLLLDRTEGGLVHSTVFQLPTDKGKGVLVTPTVHGNILVGPDSTTVGEREDVSTVADGLEAVMEKARLSVPSLNFRAVITSFAGVRASTDMGDFIIDEPVPGFFNAAAIDSPGLTAAPAIGEHIAAKIASRLHTERKTSPVTERRCIPKASQMSLCERNDLIRTDPSYGNIICRCEEISEGEIREAVRRGASTIDGVKRRVRAGMGRCQGGFCSPAVMEIISSVKGIAMEGVRKSGTGSEVIS
ncbi:MAG: NAD(P)/FAD-dependent oxidoreductase [Bullifex sp.]